MAAPIIPGIPRIPSSTPGLSARTRRPALPVQVDGPFALRRDIWEACPAWHCWDRLELRIVWNVECKQSVLPATARLGARTQTYRAVPWEQQTSLCSPRATTCQVGSDHACKSAVALLLTPALVLAIGTPASVALGSDKHAVMGAHCTPKAQQGSAMCSSCSGQAQQGMDKHSRE